MTNAGSPLSPAHWLIAHRGYPGRWPENSLSGIEAVLAAGAHYVEFDVQLSRDGVPFVAHDDRLARVGGGSSRVTRNRASTLNDSPTGEPRRFGAQFSDERLPDLRSMLALLADWPAVTVFIEIKRASLRHFGRHAVIEPVLEAVSDAANPCILISFDAPAMALARERGAARIGWVFEHWNRRARARAEQLAPDYLFVDETAIPTGPAPFWPGDWYWAVYTINDLDQALALRERGAELIETDWLPDLVAAWEERR